MKEERSITMDEILQNVKMYFQSLDEETDQYRTAPKEYYTDRKILAENRLRELVGLPIVA
jgi:hypothetical protein